MRRPAIRSYRNHLTENNNTLHRSNVKGMPFFSTAQSFFQPVAPVQPKLKANAPDDIYEKESDAVADQVMRMPDPQIQRQEEEEEMMLKPQPLAVQHKCAECEVEENLQRKPLWGNITPFFQRKEASGELTHELAHVIQQNSYLPGKGKGKGIIQRSVRANATNCPANTNNSPADPIVALQRINDTAVRYARGTARLLDFSALLIQAGDPGFIEAEYERAFGLPQASGVGFVNRLTGQVRATQDIALSEEMNLFSQRFDLIADFLDQPIAYRCDPPLTWGGCNFSACDGNDNAGACTGTGAIKICPHFWDHGEEAQAGILIHEVTHIYWAAATHNVPSNLRLSQCYEELVAQIYGFNAPSQVCPVP